MNRHFFTCAVLAAWMLVALSGCGGSAAADDDDAPDIKGTVLVVTALPTRRTFHDTIQAWGNVAGDPCRGGSVSLGHGGLVTGMAVAVGQTVQRGQTLLRIAPEPAARSAFLQAQSALDLASGELRRTTQMVAQHLATQSQLAAARKALDDAKANVDAQRALGGSAMEEPLRAPDDGVVTALNVNLGDRFQAGAPLLSFAPAHALVARLSVSPDHGAQLEPGMPVSVQGAYGSRQTVQGRIAMVGRAIDAQTHLLPVQVDLPQDAGGVMAGAAVQATIETNSYTAWALPRDAVLRDDQGDYVFAVDHGHAKRIGVTLKHPDGDVVGVQGPLDGHMRIVVLGNYELDDGDPIREQQEPAK